MTEYEAYQEHIRYTHDTYCRIVIRHASFDAARMLAAALPSSELRWCRFPDAQAKTLLKSPSPLADILKDWEYKETSSMEDI